MIKKQVLNYALGIDISKSNFSYSLCFLNVDFSKDFEVGVDLSNDKKGFIALLKWIKKSGVSQKELTIVMDLQQKVGHFFKTYATFLI